MQHIVSPLVPFPNIWWWSRVMNAAEVTFDHAEHFAKMTYRNRYYITGANGRIQLTVPLTHGRNQRTPMQDVLIDNNERWQVQHWRTLVSVYARAPYFEHYAPALEPLFLLKFDKLVAFSEATIQLLKKETGISFNENKATEYKEYDTTVTDLRKTFKPHAEKTEAGDTQALYYQLFSERNGFYPNLSILDLLFSEGPAVKQVLEQHKTIIETWHK